MWNSVGSRPRSASHRQIARGQLMDIESKPQSDVLIESGTAPHAAAWMEDHSAREVWRSIFREDRFFLLLSVFIGIFSGLAVVCFRFASDWARIYLLGTGAVLTPVRLLLAPT